MQSRYVVIERIAVGGMGEVFVARQQGVGNFRRTVVLKRLLQNAESSDDALVRMLDEARIGAALNHENVVSIIEVGEDPAPFLALEYVHGENAGTLRARAAKRGLEMPVVVVARIVADSARGLDHAHNAKDVDGQPLRIVHRDIAPKNIFVRHDGVSKVGDFGIAHAAERLYHTATGAVPGTLTYMAPEQLQNDVVTAKTDQFALGIVLWELLTSKRLFGGHNLGPVAVAERILTAKIPPPSTIRPDVPRALDDITCRMLERDPKRRFPDCGEVAAAIEHALPDVAAAVGRAAVKAFVDEVVGAELEERQRRIEFGRADDATDLSLPPAWRDPSASASASAASQTRAKPLPSSKATTVSRPPRRPLRPGDAPGAGDDGKTAPSRPRRALADTVAIDDSAVDIHDDATRTSAEGDVASAEATSAATRSNNTVVALPSASASAPPASRRAVAAGLAVVVALAIVVVGVAFKVGVGLDHDDRADRVDDDIGRTRAYLNRAIDLHPYAWQEAFLTSARQAGADAAVAERVAEEAMALMRERLTMLARHAALDEAARQAGALAVVVEEQRLEAAAKAAFSVLPAGLAASALDLWALDSTAPRGWLPPRSQAEIQATLRKSGLHYMEVTAKSRREIVDRLWQRAGLPEDQKAPFHQLVLRYEATLVASSTAEPSALAEHHQQLQAIRDQGEAFLRPLCAPPWPAVVAGAAFLSQPDPEHWEPIYERTPSERDKE